MKVKAEEVPTRVETLLEELRTARNEISAAHAKAAVYKASIVANKAFPVGTSTTIRYSCICCANTGFRKSIVDALVECVTTKNKNKKPLLLLSLFYVLFGDPKFCNTKIVGCWSSAWMIWMLIH